MKHFHAYGDVRVEDGNRVRDFYYEPGPDITEEEIPMCDYNDGSRPIPLRPGSMVTLIVWADIEGDE